MTEYVLMPKQPPEGSVFFALFNGDHDPVAAFTHERPSLHSNFGIPSELVGRVTGCVKYCPECDEVVENYVHLVEWHFVLSEATNE